MTLQAEAVHPIRGIPERIGHRLHCPCGATALLCAPNTEPETAVRMESKMGLRRTRADIVDATLSIVWGRESMWRPL